MSAICCESQPQVLFKPEIRVNRRHRKQNRKKERNKPKRLFELMASFFYCLSPLEQKCNFADVNILSSYFELCGWYRWQPFERIQLAGSILSSAKRTWTSSRTEKVMESISSPSHKQIWFHSSHAFFLAQLVLRGSFDFLWVCCLISRGLQIEIHFNYFCLWKKKNGIQWDLSAWCCHLCKHRVFSRGRKEQQQQNYICNVYRNVAADSWMNGVNVLLCVMSTDDDFIRNPM